MRSSPISPSVVHGTSIFGPRALSTHRAEYHCVTRFPQPINPKPTTTNLHSDNAPIPTQDIDVASRDLPQSPHPTNLKIAWLSFYASLEIVYQISSRLLSTSLNFHFEDRLLEWGTRFVHASLCLSSPSSTRRGSQGLVSCTHSQSCSVLYLNNTDT